MQVIDVEIEVRAPAERTFALLTDHESMWRWSPGIKRVELATEGSPDRNGMGAVRVIHTGALTLREEVVGWLPPHWYEYRLVGRAPVRDHLGRVEVEARGEDRCKVRWRIEFRPVVPGTGLIVRLALGASIKGMLENAKKLAERGDEGIAA